MVNNTSREGRLIMKEQELDRFLRDLGKDNLYLCLTHDGEYEIYISEVLDMYGELICAGLGNSLGSSIEDLEQALRRDNEE